MVNEERLHYMIKMAKFDANDGKKCKPMIQYVRRDYVSLQMLKSFVTGTICYGLLLVLWGLYSMETLMEKMNQLNERNLQALFIIVIGLYISFMIIYMSATYFVYEMKYTDGRRKVKKYFNSLKRVNQIYEREKRLKMSPAAHAMDSKITWQ